MSIESHAPFGDELAHEIRAQVAAAKDRQRKLNETQVHAKQVMDSLRVTLDEIGAYIHRETGLDVITGHEAPTYLTDSPEESATERIAVETRGVTVPTFPPTTLQGGYEVVMNIDGTMKILAFWTTGDCKHVSSSHCWKELFEGTYTPGVPSPILHQASKALYCKKQTAAEFLLDSLRAL